MSEKSNYYNPFPLGRRVYDLRYEYGTVIQVKAAGSLPIIVEFKNGLRIAYNFDGREDCASAIAMLYSKKMKVVID